MANEERAPQDLEQLEPKDVVDWLKRNPMMLMEVAMSYQLGISTGSLVALGKTREYIHAEVNQVIDEAEKAKAALTPKCDECGGDLGGTAIGRLEDHKEGCSKLPL